MFIGGLWGEFRLGHLSSNRALLHTASRVWDSWIRQWSRNPLLCTSRASSRLLWRLNSEYSGIRGELELYSTLYPCDLQSRARRRVGGALCGWSSLKQLKVTCLFIASSAGSQASCLLSTFAFLNHDTHRWTVLAHILLARGAPELTLRDGWEHTSWRLREQAGHHLQVSRLGQLVQGGRLYLLFHQHDLANLALT